MNIFVLASDPRIAASYHCDQHMNKMILESAQMLSTVAKILHPKHPSLMHLYNAPKSVYKHPCTLWIKESIHNARWVLDLAIFLQHEREKAGAIGTHKSLYICHDAYSIISDAYITDGAAFLSNPFIFCGTDTAKVFYNGSPINLNVPASYQALYKEKYMTSIKNMSWKNRPIPNFMSDVYGKPV